MKIVDIYTDGSCLANGNGPGGYGAILIYRDTVKELSGGSTNTTNNRMELTAAIAALSSLKVECIVNLYSDSKYLVDSVNKSWLNRWVSNGWRNSTGKVPNQDLWEQLLLLNNRHSVNYHWVKGHAGNDYNERCDALAKATAIKYKLSVR